MLRSRDADFGNNTKPLLRTKRRRFGKKNPVVLVSFSFFSCARKIKISGRAHHSQVILEQSKEKRERTNVHFSRERRRLSKAIQRKKSGSDDQTYHTHFLIYQEGVQYQ